VAGNKTGGAKAASTNKRKYGDGFYEVIGAKGGKAKVPKGFALMDPEKVSMAGAKGGSISRRGKSKVQEPKSNWYEKLIRRTT